MKKTFLLVLSSLCVLSGCSGNPDSTLMSKKDYVSFVTKLITSNFTLEESAYTIEINGVKTEASAFISQFQIDFPKDSYSCTAVLDDGEKEYYVWFPDSANDPHGYWYCTKTMEEGSWTHEHTDYSDCFVDWFIDYTRLSYDETEKCYTGMVLRNGKIEITYNYYVIDKAITEFSQKIYHSDNGISYNYRFKITDIGKTMIDKPNL